MLALGVFIILIFVVLGVGVRIMVVKVLGEVVKFICGLAATFRRLVTKMGGGFDITLGICCC